MSILVILVIALKQQDSTGKKKEPNIIAEERDDSGRDRRRLEGEMASGRTADLGTSDEWFKHELRYHVRRLLEDDQGRLETFRSCDPRAIAEIVNVMERYKRSRKEVIDR